jgi:hypothetical protein
VIEDGGVQVFGVAYVNVERGGAGRELGGDPAHRDAVDPLGLGDARGGLDDLRASPSAGFAWRRPGRALTCARLSTGPTIRTHRRLDNEHVR